MNEDDTEARWANLKVVFADAEVQAVADDVRAGRRSGRDLVAVIRERRSVAMRAEGTG